VLTGLSNLDHYLSPDGLEDLVKLAINYRNKIDEDPAHYQTLEGGLIDVCGARGTDGTFVYLTVD
jgi:hypothetical protein